MKTQWNQPGRAPIYFSRRSPGGILPLITILFSLLIPLPACLVSSCKGDVESEIYPGDVVEVKVDSCDFVIHFKVEDALADTTHHVGDVDLLIYNADGVRELDSWQHLDSLPDSLLLRLPRRSWMAVALANSPRKLNRAAIEHYESIELLSCEFDEDSPEHPLMSGLCSMEPDLGGSLTLMPLMSRVVLSSISNTMSGYVRLEDPRVFLQNMNVDAEVLRFSGFRPSEFILSERKEPLPYDVGVFPQSPGTELFCYPNDSASGTMGTPATVFVLECEIGGSTCRFPVSLPSVPRNATLHVELSVSGKDSAESKVY